jgi:hypothetical protein
MNDDFRVGHYMRQHFPNRIIQFSLLFLGLSICLVGSFEANALWAQDAGPDPNTTGEIQQVAPQGVSQEEWNERLEHCNELSAEVVRRQGLPADQVAQLPTISYDEIENCRGMAGPVRNQYQPSGPTSVDPVLPVPVASPTPPSDPLNDASTGPTGASAEPVKGNPVPLGIGPPR